MHSPGPNVIWPSPRTLFAPPLTWDLAPLSWKEDGPGWPVTVAYLGTRMSLPLSQPLKNVLSFPSLRVACLSSPVLTPAPVLPCDASATRYGHQWDKPLYSNEGPPNGSHYIRIFTKPKIDNREHHPWECSLPSLPPTGHLSPAHPMFADSVHRVGTRAFTSLFISLFQTPYSYVPGLWPCLFSGSPHMHAPSIDNFSSACPPWALGPLAFGLRPRASNDRSAPPTTREPISTGTAME